MQIPICIYTDRDGPAHPVCTGDSIRPLLSSLDANIDAAIRDGSMSEQSQRELEMELNSIIQKLKIPRYHSDANVHQSTPGVSIPTPNASATNKIALFGAHFNVTNTIYESDRDIKVRQGAKEQLQQILWMQYTQTGIVLFT